MATLINGREYEWSDVSVVLDTKIITRITKISYKEEQTKKAIYGKGNKPISIQRGNKSYTASITVLQSVIEELIQYAKAQGKTSILDLSFDIVVCYGDPSKGDVMTTDKIIGGQFSTNEKSIEAGNENMEITLDVTALDIQYQI